ncbi:hypothetical protein [Flavobacterium caeni]|uniref:DinB superfamily protein n=1 Tax=Flavobacterium caeni TaxID=490189 RepID=A0A1G5HJ14_9FLAO|nr:hypothetical protein [Flavobacterium caeni]SCY63855.1 hypothetical protein SAMN02927903_01869 [Flavobacterium caeni]
MDQPTRQVFSANFDAGLQMLSHAVRICPDGLWQQHGRFYHLAYHTVIFADYYLTHPVRDFAPMPPYQLADPDDLPETAVDDVLPESAISRNQLLAFIEHIQKKNREFWAKDVDFEKRWIETDEIALHGLCPRACPAVFGNRNNVLQPAPPPASRRATQPIVTATRPDALRLGCRAPIKKPIGLRRVFIAISGKIYFALALASAMMAEVS